MRKSRGKPISVRFTAKSSQALVPQITMPSQLLLHLLEKNFAF